MDVLKTTVFVIVLTLFIPWVLKLQSKGVYKFLKIFLGVLILSFIVPFYSFNDENISLFELIFNGAWALLVSFIAYLLTLYLIIKKHKNINIIAGSYFIGIVFMWISLFLVLPTDIVPASTGTNQMIVYTNLAWLFFYVLIPTGFSVLFIALLHKHK